MKYQSVYLTVRIDMSVPDDMSYEEIEDLVNELDYNFSLPSDSNNISVVDTEICGIND